MTTKLLEVLTLAEEALEGVKPLLMGTDTVDKALATIRAARAQEQAEQKPVAYCCGLENTHPDGWIDCKIFRDGEFTTPLYAAPVQQAEQKPAAYLCDGARYKVMGEDRSGFGRILGLPESLAGQWVALVDATDGKHLRAAPVQQVEQEPEYKGWYCAHCERGVDGSEVTFHEQHEVCGRVITNDVPPKPVKQEPALKVGNLVTINQDPYPALGKLFVQLWDGDDLIARVYANDEETLNKRVAVLNAANWYWLFPHCPCRHCR